MKFRVLPALLLALLVGVLAWSLLLRESQPRASAAREWKHVFLIVVDTLRRDHVSLYGDAARTPNMERLARKGQVFEAAVSSFHQTTMSTAAIFTGRTPSLEKADGGRMHWNGQTWCGLARMASDTEDTCIPAALPTLADGMRDAGYRTIGVVANELIYAPGGFERGFDEWIEIAPEIPPGYDENGVIDPSFEAARLRIATAVNAALFTALDGESGEQPLFVYLHYIDVHDHTLAREDYAEMVHLFDIRLGHLLDGLEARGLLSDSLLVLTSDHGEALGEEHGMPANKGHLGNPSFQTVLDVPLITSHVIKEDTDTFLRSQDIFDLMLRAAGTPGRDPQDIAREEQYLSEHAYQTYRKGRWKSTRPRDGGALVLFDLETDPRETRNVAAEHPAIVAEHQARLDEVAADLRAKAAEPARLKAYDEERLRRLGYIE